MEKTLHELIDGVLGEGHARPDVICLGIAGVDRAEDNAIIQGIMRRIGARARILVTNDALIALVAGAGVGPGVVVIAGTGSIAYGRNDHGEAARAGAWVHGRAAEIWLEETSWPAESMIATDLLDYIPVALGELL